MSDSHSAEALVAQLLAITESSIIPLTRAQVSSGSKLFGAAILSQATLQPITVATNNERESPLLHGEINCIQTFFATHRDAATRPSPRDCVFFATHEPCSLCLSGITWSGFREFYYLFTYADSRDAFGIPYDIDILQSVYQVPGVRETAADLAAKPLYNRVNKFFRAAAVADLVAKIDDPVARERWTAEIARIKRIYEELSETYQRGKAAGHESASVFK